MKYIERWALMRSTRPENLSEHSLEVAMIAHALCLIANVRYGKKLPAEKAALIGLYHDVSEIITGDMPTPVKYGNDNIRISYHEVEDDAKRRLLSKLPEDLQPYYSDILTEESEDENDRYLFQLVKAADKMSAYIKCIEERQAGNREFETALISIEKKLREIAEEYPEVKDYMEDFLPAYGETLDTLLG
jgi:5'-deoxynucleotidase